VPGSAAETFRVALRLGVTSFGGPVAHLGYFREEYVRRRRWLDDEQYAELVGLCQVLPGPTSSQVGVGVGFARAGGAGALAAWLGFTLPSALVMGGFAALALGLDVSGAAWVQALKLVAVAVVAAAVIEMGSRLARTRRTAAVALAAFLLVVLTDRPYSAPLALVLTGVAGVFLFADAAPRGPTMAPVSVSRRAGLLSLGLFGMLFLLAPALAALGELGETAAAMYRAGALVFGGGHVVLPLLQSEVVPDLMDQDTFLTGYGVAQAVPGPLFSFGTYVGEVSAGWTGAVVATVLIFLPGVLLLLGLLPFWSAVRDRRLARSGLVAVNAAVVGVLAAALYDPIITGTVHTWRDVAFAGALFLGLQLGRLPSWVVVLAALAASPVLAL
jgi:chromate transporter